MRIDNSYGLKKSLLDQIEHLQRKGNYTKNNIVSNLLNSNKVLCDNEQNFSNTYNNANNW